MPKGTHQSAIAPIEPFAMLYRTDLRAAARAGHPQALAVFAYLLTWAAGTETIYPGQDTIADELDVSVDTVQRAVKALAAAGLVSIEPHLYHGRKVGNEYTIHGLVERLRAENGNRTTAASAKTAILPPTETAASRSTETAEQRLPREIPKRETIEREKPTASSLSSKRLAEIANEYDWPKSFIEFEYAKFCEYAEAMGTAYVNVDKGFGLWLSRSRGPKGMAP